LTHGSARAEPIYSVGPTRGRRKTHLKNSLKKTALKRPGHSPSYE